MHTEAILKKPHASSGLAIVIVTSLLMMLVLLNEVGAAQSQEPLRVRTYTTGAGLPGLGVSALLQDRLGFLWLGTQNGLAQWDGYTFKTFKPVPGDSTSISDRHVTALCESRGKGIWVGTRNGGLNFFDRGTEHFTRYLHDPKNPNTLSSKFVTAICEASTGIVWVGTARSGLDSLEPTTGTVTHFVHDPRDPNSISDNSITVIFEDRSGVLWIGTKGGLTRMIRGPAAGEIFTTFAKNPRDPDGLKSNWITAISQGERGSLWIGTLGGGHHSFDPHSKVFRPYENRGYEDIWSMRKDRFGLIWVASVHGISVFDPATGKFTNYEETNVDPFRVSYGATATIYEDRTGILWFGTFESGLKKLDRSRERFSQHRLDPKNPHSLNNNYVWSLLEDRSGILWVGTHGGGLNRLNLQTGVFAQIN